MAAAANKTPNEPSSAPPRTLAGTPTAPDRKRRRAGEPAATEPAEPTEPAELTEPARRPNSGRVWSEEDEIKLLRAVVHCVKERGVDVGAVVGPVAAHIRDELNLSYTRVQVKDKVRGLKRRWSSATERLKNYGHAPGNAHDQAVFELSREIWGGHEAMEKEIDTVVSQSSDGPVHLLSGMARDEAMDKEIVTVVSQHNKRTEKKIATVVSQFTDGPFHVSRRAHVERTEKEIATVVSQFSDDGHLGSVVRQLAEENKVLEPSGIVLRGFRRLLPARARELDERWRAHLLEGVKYSLAGSKLKDEILQACTDALEKDNL